MKNHWFQILILLWLVLLTVSTVIFLKRTHTYSEIISEQDRQAGILLKQSEILAVNTVLVRAIVEKVRQEKAESEEVTLKLEKMPQ